MNCPHCDQPMDLAMTGVTWSCGSCRYAYTVPVHGFRTWEVDEWP